MALLPRIAAGVPIDEMQIGQSVWLLNVFWDDGRLSPSGGREYVGNLAQDDQVRFRDALKARRQVFRQRAAAGTTGTPETSPLVARLYDSVFAEIVPVLDRFALNNKINDLALEAPNLKRYLTKTGLRPGGGETWLESLSEGQQTRVRNAIADRNAIRNIGPRIVTASNILANPANDLATAAAGIGCSVQDLMRLVHDSGLTERGRQYLPSLGLEREHTVEYNLQLRNRQRSAMLSSGFSFSIPATPASGANLDLDLPAWQAELMGAPAQGSPAAAYSPQSSFGMPPTPSGGWQLDFNAGEGSSNWHDDASSVPPVHSPELGFAMPATTLAGSAFAPDPEAWPAYAMGYPAYGSPAPASTPESSFAMPPTPSGGWLSDFNAGEDPSHGQDDAQSAPPPHSPAFSLSVPATPSESSHPDADLNLAAWRAHLMGASAQGSPEQTHEPEPSLATSRRSPPPRSAANLADASGARPIQTLTQMYENAFSEIAPVLDRYALNEKVTELAQEVPSIRLYLTKTGLNPRNGEAWLTRLSENAQGRVRDAIADRTAIQNLRQHLVQISGLLANPANDLPQVAASIGVDLHDLLRLFNDSGLTERGAQYVSLLRPQRQTQILHKLQLRNSQREAMPAPTPESSFVMPATPSGGWNWDHDAGEGTSHWQDATTSMPRAPSPTFSLSIPATPAASSDLALNLDAWQAQLIGEHAAASPAQIDPHEALRSIVGDLGRVSIADLQQRIGVPLDEYFVPDEGITEKGFRFLKTLSERDQMHLQLVLPIPHDVMRFHEVCSVLDQYEAGVPVSVLRAQVPAVRAYLREDGALVRGGGTEWFRRLPQERQARIALALENRQIINAIAPRFVQISSSFSNPGNDMHRVARGGGVTAEQLARFLTEDGLTALGRRFVSALDQRTRQLVEANLALRRA